MNGKQKSHETFVYGIFFINDFLFALHCVLLHLFHFQMNRFAHCLSKMLTNPHHYNIFSNAKAQSGFSNYKTEMYEQNACALTIIWNVFGTNIFLTTFSLNQFCYDKRQKQTKTEGKKKKFRLMKRIDEYRHKNLFAMKISKSVKTRTNIFFTFYVIVAVDVDVDVSVFVFFFSLLVLQQPKNILFRSIQWIGFFYFSFVSWFLSVCLCVCVLQENAIEATRRLRNFYELNRKEIKNKKSAIFKIICIWAYIYPIFLRNMLNASYENKILINYR